MLPQTEASYDPSAFPPFAVTVDLVVLTVADPGLSVLTTRSTRNCASKICSARLVWPAPTLSTESPSSAKAG